MAQLPLEQAIPRFRGNEERVDIFTNGGPSSTFLTSTGVAVPSIRKFLADKNAEINVGAASILTLATAEANAAKGVGARFLTPKTADPTTRDDGTPLVNGDTYYNTTSQLPRVRSGGQWRDGVAAATQSSITDTTAGRILTQGAFGLGLDAYTVTDANAATLNGFWTGNNITNFPSIGAVVGFSSFRSAGASGLQIAGVLGANGRIYFRRRVSSTWQQWQELVSGIIGATDGRTGTSMIPLGVDPSAWGTGYAGLQTADGSLFGGAGAMWLVDNLFNDNSNWRYVNGSNGAIFSVNGSSFSYRTAPVGTAGAISTLTTLLQMSASGLLTDRSGVLLPHDGFAAWARFNGTGIVSVSASKNVSSITDSGVGSYGINFATAMPSENYVVLGNCGNTAAAGAVRLNTTVLSTASVARIETLNTSGANLDCTTVGVGILI
jgi:hypothetical protein